jgi:hypothetical protein
MTTAAIDAADGRRPDHGLVGGALAALKGCGRRSGVTTSVRVSLLAGPNCDVILGWDPRAVPADWQGARARYFRLNWLRLRAWLTWLACGCSWP